MSQVIEKKELKINKIKKRHDFLRVAAGQRKWITPAMIVQFESIPDNEIFELRVGYTASKRVGNAVIRSRAKRRMREVARQVLGKFAHVGYDYVIIARREIINYPFNELIRDLKWALKRLHEDPVTKMKGKN